MVADATGAIVPNAEIDLLDTNGTVATIIHSDGEGNFQIVAPHPGNFTLVVSESGFETVRTSIAIPGTPAAAGPSSASVSPKAPASLPGASLLRIVLPPLAVSTTVNVNAENSEDLTAPDANHDSSVMTAGDLKALPIFDNDYQTAMSAFLDDSATAPAAPA